MKEATPDLELEEGGNDLNNELTSFINEINKAMGNGKNYDTKDTMVVSPFQVSCRVLNKTILYYRSLKVLCPDTCSFDKVFADILMMKVLPRIEGEQDRAKKPIEGLLQFVSRRIGDDEKRRFCGLSTQIRLNTCPNHSVGVVMDLQRSGYKQIKLNIWL